MNDRDSLMIAFMSADSVQGVLEAAEAALASGEADWRRVKGK